MGTIQEDLASILARPITTAAEAEAAQEAAGLLATYLRLEQRAIELSGRAQDAGGRETGGDLRGTTLDEAARAVLEEAGVPLHARELGARIKARGWRHPRSKQARPDQIVYQLAARLGRDPSFRRVSPNTFALAAWGEGHTAPRRAKPRLGIFRGPGGTTARDIASSDEPLSEPGAAWRSS